MISISDAEAREGLAPQRLKNKQTPTMAKISDITTLCKSGKTAEGYAKAKEIMESAPTDLTAQRCMGWAIYYRLKECLANGDRKTFLTELGNLNNLETLSYESETMLFDQVVWQVGMFLKDGDENDHGELRGALSAIKRHSFGPSGGYSFLLKMILRRKSWEGIPAAIEWWNLGKLMAEDFAPAKLEGGRTTMSLAEQAYIGYARSILTRGDKGRIARFVPFLQQLQESHPEMNYLGYFCCKLLMAMGSDRSSALQALMPFARKKRSDFWVWQLLAEIYANEPERHLACLTRATKCKTQEEFLGNVRKSLAQALIGMGDYGRARHQVERVVKCFRPKGWHLAHEIVSWSQEAWMRTAAPDESPALDYKSITNELLYADAEERIGIVTFVHPTMNRAFVVTGIRQQISVGLKQLPEGMETGSIVRLRIVDDKKVVGATEVTASEAVGVPHIKVGKGTVNRNKGAAFAFVRNGKTNAYASPEIVSASDLKNGDTVAAIFAFSYRKKEDTWNWTCCKAVKIDE